MGNSTGRQSYTDAPLDLPYVFRGRQLDVQTLSPLLTLRHWPSEISAHRFRRKEAYRTRKHPHLHGKASYQNVFLRKAQVQIDVHGTFNVAIFGVCQDRFGKLWRGVDGVDAPGWGVEGVERFGIVWNIEMNNHT